MPITSNAFDNWIAAAARDGSGEGMGESYMAPSVALAIYRDEQLRAEGAALVTVDAEKPESTPGT